MFKSCLVFIGVQYYEEIHLFLHQKSIYEISNNGEMRAIGHASTSK